MLAGWLSDAYVARLGGTRLGLLTGLYLGWAATTLGTFSAVAATNLSPAAHYALAIFLADGFASVAIVVRSSCLMELTRSERERIQIQRLNSIFGNVEFVATTAALFLWPRAGASGSGSVLSEAQSQSQPQSALASESTSESAAALASSASSASSASGRDMAVFRTYLLGVCGASAIITLVAVRMLRTITAERRAAGRPGRGGAVGDGSSGQEQPQGVNKQQQQQQQQRGSVELTVRPIGGDIIEDGGRVADRSAGDEGGGGSSSGGEGMHLREAGGGGETAAGIVAGNKKKTEADAAHKDGEQCTGSRGSKGRNDGSSFRDFLSSVKTHRNLQRFLATNSFLEAESVFHDQFDVIIVAALLSPQHSHITSVVVLGGIKPLCGIASFLLTWAAERPDIGVYGVCLWAFRCKVFVGFVACGALVAVTMASGGGGDNGGFSAGTGSSGSSGGIGGIGGIGGFGDSGGIGETIGRTTTGVIGPTLFWVMSWVAIIALLVVNITTRVPLALSGVTLANLIDEHSYLQRRASPHVAKFLSLNALIAKPLNSLGPMVGSALLASAGYTSGHTSGSSSNGSNDGGVGGGGEAGALSHTHNRTGEQPGAGAGTGMTTAAVWRTCVMLVIAPALVGGLVQWGCWRSYTLRGRYLVTVQQRMWDDEGGGVGGEDSARIT